MSKQLTITKENPKRGCIVCNSSDTEEHLFFAMSDPLHLEHYSEMKELK